MNQVENLGWHLLCRVMPKTAVKIQYKLILGGGKLDLKNPQDLNEKINYLKFHADLDEWARLADKYAVREYVIERGLSEILVPLYGKYDTPEELIADWKGVPRSLVVKANHGCGEVKIVKDKNAVDLNGMRTRAAAWLKDRYGLGTNERHYLKIKPCLIVEQLLEEPGRIAPTDYKVWCFNGKPYCILVISDRDEEHHTRHRSMYDLNWNRIPDALPHDDTYSEEDLAKPKNLDKMLEYAAILSKGHKQVRMDFYNIEGKIYFGEMTFTASGGYNMYNKKMLLELGHQFEVK